MKREQYALDEGSPVVRKENEGFASYVVLPQFFDLEEFLLQRYKQEVEKK